MHSQRVVTNETCNQNCWFCNARRPAERPAFIARAAVRARIEAARDGDPREIVLTGGEPAMRSDLADLVQRAAAGGRRVVLETNAALLDAARARALAAAGLHTARVQLVAWVPPGRGRGAWHRERHGLQYRLSEDVRQGPDPGRLS